MPARFLDTNVILRLLSGDDPEKASRALDLLKRVESGEETLETSPVVIFEVVFTLQRFYRVPRARIRDLLAPLLELRNLRLSDRAVCLNALDTYLEKNVSFADAYTSELMRARGISEVYSWDTDFDHFDGISRVES